MHPAVKLRHIRTFLAIAVTGNLSAVARAQNLTQPALSRTLAELEALLGTPLFHRQGRRLVLTDAGAAFRRHTAEAMAMLDTAAAVLTPEGTQATVRIGVLPTVASRLFPALALRFHKARPDAVLTLTTGPHDHLLHLLRDGRIDLMIGRMPAAADITGLSFTYLYDEEVVLVLRADHPQAEADPAELLSRLPMILPPDGALIRRAVDDWMAAQGIDRPQTAFETVSPEIGRGLVLASNTGWLISRGVVYGALQRGEVIALPLGGGLLNGPVGVVRRNDADTEATAALLLRLAGDLLP